MIVTHQAYKSYSDSGSQRPISFLGTEIPEDFPDESTIRPVDENNYQYFLDEGYTLIPIEEWDSHIESFLDHQYFLEEKGKDSYIIEEREFIRKVSAREEAGKQIRLKITAQLDKAAESLGDPVAEALAGWRSDGLSRDQIKPELLDLIRQQSDDFNSVDALMTEVMSKLSSGSLQRALMFLADPNNAASVPAQYKSFYNYALDLVLVEVINNY